MGHKTGVHITDESDWEYIEDERIVDGEEGREIRERSAVLRELLALGITARRAWARADFDVETGREEQAATRQAILDAIREE